MMHRARLILAACAALILLLPGSARATTVVVTVQIHPAVGSNSGQARLNCGWHVTCAPPWGDGNGLDWDDDHGTCCGTGRTVYFRSWNFFDQPFAFQFGDVHIVRDPNQFCFEVRAHIRRVEDLDTEGTFIFQHADRVASTYTVPLSGSLSGTYSGAVTAGTMVSSEKCSAWDAPHLHTKHATGLTSFGKNIGPGPAAVPRAGDCLSNPPCKYTYGQPGAISSVWERQIIWSTFVNNCMPPPC